MAELKTKLNDGDVLEFVNAVNDDVKRTDSLALLKLFTKITGEKPKMWGTSIIGFGQYHYKSERSSQEGDWPLTGFSPRKQSLTLYLMPGFKDYEKLLAKLCKHKVSVGCVYIKRLTDVNTDVLEQLISETYHAMKKQHA